MGTQLGKFNHVTGANDQNEVATGKSGTAAMVGLVEFSSCLGNFKVEISVPQPSAFANIVQESRNSSDYQIPGFQ